MASCTFANRDYAQLLEGCLNFGEFQSVRGSARFSESLERQRALDADLPVYVDFEGRDVATLMSDLSLGGSSSEVNLGMAWIEKQRDLITKLELEIVNKDAQLMKYEAIVNRSLAIDQKSEEEIIKEGHLRNVKQILERVLGLEGAHVENLNQTLTKLAKAEEKISHLKKRSHVLKTRQKIL